MNYLEEFKQHLFEDGKSPTTIASYVGDVRGFLIYLESKGTVFDGQLRRFYVTSYKKLLQDNDYKINTINKKINSLVCFNRFLLKVKQMDELVVDLRKDKIRIAYGSEQEVEIYSEVEIERLLFYIQDLKRVSIRDKLIIHLLLFTGIRVSELVSIKLQDLDLLTMQLHVRGKGGKVREVPLRAEVVEVTKEHMDTERREHKFNASEHLILTQRSPRMDQDPPVLG